MRPLLWLLALGLLAGMVLGGCDGRPLDEPGEAAPPATTTPFGACDPAPAELVDCHRTDGGFMFRDGWTCATTAGPTPPALCWSGNARMVVPDCGWCTS